MIPLGVLAQRQAASAGGIPLNPTYVTQATDSAAKATFTWTGVSIGSASASRTVLVVFQTRITSSITSAQTITAATIAGDAASVDYFKHVTPAESGGSAVGAVGFLRLPVPSGTTATISVTVSSNCLRAGISVYTFDGPADLIGTGWRYESGGGTNYTIGPLSTATDGAAIAASTGVNLANIMTSPTPDHDTLIGSGYDHTTSGIATDGAAFTPEFLVNAGGVSVMAAATYAAA